MIRTELGRCRVRALAYEPLHEVVMKSSFHSPRETPALMEGRGPTCWSIRHAPQRLAGTFAAAISVELFVRRRLGSILLPGSCVAVFVGELAVSR